MSTLSVKINNQAVTVVEKSLKMSNKVNDKLSCSFTVRDDTGTLIFQKMQPVTVTDSAQGVLFSGFVNKPTCTNLFPQSTNLWSIDCVNQFAQAAKKATTNTTTKKHRGGKHKNQPAGAIVANQIQQYLAPDGVTGNFGLDWSELQTDWQTGTLTGVTAATNTSTGNEGAGDLELASGGTSVAFQQTTHADFSSGITFFGNPLGVGLASPVSGGLAFLSTQAIQLISTVSLPGLSNPVLEIQIWSGSYTIASSDILSFAVWIADSCPQQMASLDLHFSDGTTFSLSQAVVGTDSQGVGPAITNDLSGLATNQWYQRSFTIDGGGTWVGKTLQSVAVCLGGSQQGTYTAYFRNISVQNGGATSLSIFSKTATTTQAIPQPIQTSGYTNTTVQVVTSYERTGFLYSAFYDLSSAGIAGNSWIDWTVTLPSTSFVVNVAVSIDSYTSYNASNQLGSFLYCTQQATIPGILPGMNLSGLRLLFRYDFTNNGNDPTLTPLLSIMHGLVRSAPPCTKSDIVSEFNTTATWSTGTMTNLVVATPYSDATSLQLNGNAWNYANGLSTQTLYGSSSPSQAVVKQQFTLTSGTGTDARSRLDFAGSNWQNFTMECDVTALSSSSSNIGVVYRTVNWGPNNDSYGYAANISTTQVSLAHGTNSSGAGGFTSIATASITLSASTTYRLKIVVNGNNHQVYVNNVQLINANDSTYTAAGYVGLRVYNNSGGTLTGNFANVGIMASLTGQWVSPAIDIHSLSTISNSQIILRGDVNINLSQVSFLTEISLNNGVTWTTCTPTSSSQGLYQIMPVPGLAAGANVSSMTQVLLRLTITSSTAATATILGTYMPDLLACTLFVIGAYSSTGTRSTAPLFWDNMIRGNVSGNFGTATNGQTYTQAGTGTVALTSNEATISNTTGDVHMRAGTSTGTDLDGTVNFQLSASTITAGMELRYSDTGDFYRFSANTTTITITKESVGLSPITLKTTSMTLSIGTWYTMHFRVTGSGPVTLQGSVWLKGTTEPSSFSLTATD